MPNTPDNTHREDYFRAIVPPRFHTARPRDFDFPPPDFDDGLLVTGEVGTGKTHLAAAVVFRMVTDPKSKLWTESVHWTTAIGLLRDLQLSFGDRDARAEIEERVRRPLLVVDDFGAEKPTDWAQSVFLDIINTRMDRLQPTIITTNLTGKDLELVNRRIHDRLRTFTRQVMTGKSRRGT